MRQVRGLWVCLLALSACGDDSPTDMSALDASTSLLDAQVDASASDGRVVVATQDGAGPITPAPSPYVVCSASDWCFDRPKPTSHTLLAGTRIGPRDVWLVGESGTLLNFDGMNLRGVPTEMTATLRAACTLSATDAWAVGDALSLLHFDGNAWNKVSVQVDGDGGVATPADLFGVWGASSSDVWAVGSAGTLYRYGALGWIKQTAPANVPLRAVWGSAADHVFAVGDGGTVVQFDGQMWTKTALGGGALSAIHGLSETDVWAVGAAGRVVHYDGMTWKAVELTLPKVDLLSVRAIAASQIVVTGKSGSMYTYDGTTWRARTTGIEGDLQALIEAGNADLLSVGGHGAVVRFSGEQRTIYSSGSNANYLDLFSAPDGGVQFVVGDEVLRLDSAGYTPLPTDSPRSLYDGFALSPDMAWAVGTMGTILRWDGSHFRISNSGTDKALRGVWAASSTSAFVVGAQGLVLGLFNGSAWQPISTGVTKDLYDVWGSAADDTWAVGDGGSLLHWNGMAWTVVPAPMGTTDAGLRSLWGTARDDIWAAGTLGTILHWNGTAWSVSQKGDGYTINGLWGRSRSDVYAVGSAGTVLHYDGKTWTPEQAPAAVTLFAVGAGSDRTVRAVGEDGVILYKR